MTPTSDSWVRRFLVSDPKKHKKGFTVYKVTSIVYQKGSPEAGTKVVVWKRYNDFKKLHTELQEKYRRLYHQGDFPTFAKAKFFGRFEEEVVEERRKCAVMLLDFVGSHPLLFTSDTFVKFFETGHSPDGLSKYELLANDKRMNAHAQAVLISPFVDAAQREPPEPPGLCPSPQGSVSLSSHGSRSDEDSEASCSGPGPSAQAAAGCGDAVGGEVRSGEFAELSSAVCERPDCEPQPQPRPQPQPQPRACPLLGLHCYKVLGLIGHLMLVRNTVDGRCYVMKVLHKSSCPVEPGRQRMLPVAVPYLVPLHCFFETDTTVFLVLEHVRAGRLWDSVRCGPRPAEPMLEPGASAISVDTAELLWKAQRLLSSVCETLHRAEGDAPAPAPAPVLRPSLHRRYSSDELLGPPLAPPAPSLPEGQVRRWAAQLVLCLEGLHRCGLVYRDLRPDNVLLGAGGTALLSYTCSWPAVEQAASAQAVRQLYSAPEVTSIFEASEAADWWSLGALLFELITGQALHSSQPGGLHSHSILSFPEHVSPEAQSLLTELLRYHPLERLGAGAGGVAELKSHPFFCGVDWPTLEAAGLQAEC